MNKLLLVLFLVLLVSCYQFSELSIRTSDSNQIEFYLDNKILDKHDASGYYLSDFGVSKDNCTADCVFWEIVSGDDSNTPAVINNSFKYGVIPKGMELRYPAKVLTPGKYTGSGTVVFTGNTAGVAGMPMLVKFDIGNDAKINLK